MRFAVLALTSSHGPWLNLLENGPEKTWLSDSNIVHYASVIGERPRLTDKFLNRVYESRFSKQFWRERSIQLSALTIKTKSDGQLEVNVFENWKNITIKTLKGIEYCIDNWEFDYLIRINSTAYIDLSNLTKLLEEKNFPDYCGPVLSNKQFVSGWAIIISKKSAQLLVKSHHQKVLFDDEFIGLTLKDRDIYPVPLTYCEIKSETELLSAIDQPEDTALWRFKSFSSNGERNDAELMIHFHNKKNKS